jgi:methionyl-tRNA formyltransferase
LNGLKIVFMGTPEFALPALEKIYHSRHRIVGVVSQPDRPRGRGKKLLPTPVKQFALDHNISPVLQPELLKDPEFIAALQALNADLFVVVAFRILPEIMFSMPPKGCINLHPSLLPRYRGAAPLHWTIIKGETVTGITTIFLKKQVDAGNIILQKEMPVYPADTFGDLHDRLAPAGADLLLESLDLIRAGTVETKNQDDALATPAPKLTKETCRLNFARPAPQVKNWIHGLSPLPGAYAFYREEMIKFYRATVVDTTRHSELPGTIVKAHKKDLWIACQPGIVAIEELQLQGRKTLKTGDFLRGVSLTPGEIFK